MSRRADPILRTLLGAALAVIAGPTPARAAPPEDAATAPDTVIEEYLSDHGLNELLGAQLRRRLNEASGQERVPIAERLGRLYVAQLGTNLSAEDRRTIEQLSRDLLRTVADADSFALRLDLAKASYLRAEEAVERDRLRLAKPDDKLEAERVLKSVGPTFQEIASKVSRKVEGLERRESAGREDEGLREELAEARRLRSLAYYYAGWTDYYLSVVSASTASAGKAMEEFGVLLNAPPGRAASVDRVPKSLLKFEHVARAALGCALCASLRSGDTEALRWLDLLESSEELPKPVADLLFSKRMIILATGRRWADLELLVRHRRTGNGLTPGTPLQSWEARLLGVLTLEALAETKNRERRVETVESLAQTALSELIAQGQVGDVLDLVQRYGTAPIGQEGFIPAYVRGLQAYERAREQHRASGVAETDPATDPGIINRYHEAAWGLQIAVESPDAGKFGDQRPRASLMLGLALFYGGDFEKAAERFDATAAMTKDPRQRADALWYTVVSLDRAVEKSKPSLAEARDRAATLFLNEFPSSENAARLLLKRAGAGLLPDDKTVEILLQVPASSPLYATARRQAGNILFKVFRAAVGPRRDEVGTRFLQFSDELLRIDAQNAVSGGAADAGQSLVRTVRQIGEVATGLSTPDVARLDAAIETLDQIVAAVKIDIAAAEDELTYRRLQSAIQKRRTDIAEQQIARLRAKGGPFAAAAERVMYREALAAWHAAPNDARAAKSVVASGTRVIEQVASKPGALQDPGVIAICNDVADAASAAWELEKDTAMRDAALRLDRRVIEGGRPPAAALRRYAVLTEAAGDTNAALDAWRRLVASMPPEDPAWYEARYQSLRLLSSSDPGAARSALDQHKLLHPDFGPAPWGQKLRDLDSTLPAPLPPSPAPGVKGGGT